MCITVPDKDTETSTSHILRVMSSTRVNAMMRYCQTTEKRQQDERQTHKVTQILRYLKQCVKRL